MDFKTICRVCLEEKKGLNSLFGASVAKMLMACSSIIVIEGDGLPDQICKQCTIKASQAYRFKELCEKSDNTLREYLSSTKLTNEISEIKSDLLLTDNNSLVGVQCTFFSDIFMKNDALSDPLLIEPSALSAEQCLSSLWNTNMKPLNDNTNSFYENTLQNINVDKNTKDDWNIDLDIDNQDLDSSTYIKSYIDLDHSSRIINEERLNKRQNDTFNCQICGKIFTDAKTFKKHHHTDPNSEKRFVCSICGKIYKENKLLTTHMRVHTGERPFTCEICGKTFAHKSSSHKHRQLHTGIKKHKCLFCDKSYYQLSNFNVHMRTHTGLKPFICNICGKSHSTKSDLDRHALSHTGIKPFHCLTCDNSFRTRSQLKRHEIKHSGVKKFMCSRCGQSFAHKETYDTHVRYHTNERKYKCSICSKTYVASSHLRRHMLTHTNERRYQCTICDKLFMQRRHLSNHMNTHTGQRPYACMVCGRSFGHSGTLSTHMKTHKKLCDTM